MQTHLFKPDFRLISDGEAGAYCTVGLVSPIHLLKLKYYGTLTYITQIVISNTHLNTLKGVFRDNLLLIAEIQNF